MSRPSCKKNKNKKGKKPRLPFSEKVVIICVLFHSSRPTPEKFSVWSDTDPTIDDVAVAAEDTFM